MRSVVEYYGFVKKAEKLFGTDEREKIVLFLSSNPKTGKKLEHFGGIRRFEWKSNPEHNIYFHPGTNNLPLVIIGVFRKHEKLVPDKIIEILIHGKIN